MDGYWAIPCHFLETLAVLSGDTSIAWRNVLSTIALLALVSGSVVAGLRLGILRRVSDEDVEPTPVPTP